MGGTEKPNCLTCPHNVKSENRKGYRKCAITNYLLDKDFDLVKHMDVVTCLSHPGAKEWMMRDVVTELERLSNQNVGSQYKYALTEAISLIRGEK